jgi:hypothetical protein
VKARRAPSPIEYRRDRLFERTARFTQSVSDVTRGLGHRSSHHDLSDPERLQVRVEIEARRHGVDREAYGRLLARWINHLRSPVIAPIMNDPISDAATAWAQREGRAFWESWAPEIRGYRAAAYEGSRTAAVATAALVGPYFRDGWSHANAGSALTSVLAEHAAYAGRAGRGAEPTVLREYSAATRHLPRLAEGTAFEAMSGCVGIVRELARMFPESPIGRYIVVDGTDVPAWCVQRSAKRNGVLDPDLETYLRRRVPSADYRIYSRDRSGVFDPDLEPNRKPNRTNVKAWRGYLMVVAADAVTGLPLCGVMPGASMHEPRALQKLLPLLFALWPDMPAEAIIADAAWDEGSAHELAAVHYGLRLIARRSDARLTNTGKLFAPDDPAYRGGVARVDGRGIAYCRVHDAPLQYEGCEMPSREGLLPGEPFGEGDAARHARRFRSRWRCDQGCGRLTLPTRLAWSTAPYYPHNPCGRPDLHSFRVAALSRRNVVESLFSSMKSGQRNGLRGSSRTRLFDKDTVEMLTWLGLLSRSLLMIASARSASEDG